MAFYHLRVPWRAGNGKTASFGMDFETPVSLTGGELQDIADTATTEWFTNQLLYAVDIDMLPCTIQGFERAANVPPQPAGWHREPTTTVFEGSAAPVVGLAAGNSTPPQTALVVTLRTASPMRRSLGRCYTGPPPESVSDGAGNISDFAARATMVQDIAASVEGAIAPVDVDHVVYSVTYDVQAEVTAYVANEVADTQRRRATRSGS